MATCYIIGAGEGFVPFAVREGDLVIAADGGIRHLDRHGIRPHLVIGDLDSCERVPEGVEILRHPVRKDDTDMGLSLAYAIAQGYRHVVLFGALGGREDHTFANYHLLFSAKEQGVDVRIRSTDTEIRAIVRETASVEGAVGDTLSLFAWGSPAHGVTLEGVSYPLADGTLSTRHPLGVSNALTEPVARIGVRAGALLCFHVRATDTQ